ncbi:unnamed protein product, partial [Rotaria magnacalcarata]
MQRTLILFCNFSKFHILSIFICPTSCYTMQYLTNQQEYPLFGNETYSG